MTEHHRQGQECISCRKVSTCFPKLRCTHNPILKLPTTTLAFIARPHQMMDCCFYCFCVDRTLLCLSDTLDDCSQHQQIDNTKRKCVVACHKRCTMAAARCNGQKPSATHRASLAMLEKSRKARTLKDPSITAGITSTSFYHSNN